MCPSWVGCAPCFFHLVSQSPTTCHVYLSNSWVSSCSFPVWASVLTFHVPMLMYSLPRIFFPEAPPVAYLSPPPWCSTEGAVLVSPGDDRAGIDNGVVFISCSVSWAGKPGGAHPSPGCWPQPISPVTWWIALALDTWPLSSHGALPSWSLTSMKFVRPVMLCRHHGF